MQMPHQGEFIDGIEAILAGDVSEDGQRCRPCEEPRHADQAGKVVKQSGAGRFRDARRLRGDFRTNGDAHVEIRGCGGVAGTGGELLPAFSWFR